MHEKNKTQLEKLIKSYQERGLFTHCFAEVGKLTEDKPAFSFFLKSDQRTVFDLGSITKGVVTTPLIFNEGLAPSTTLGKWLGAKGSHGLSSALMNLTFEEILSHKSGLPAWRNFYVNKGERTLATILNTAGEQIKNKGKDLYSDVGFILLGFCLEHKYAKSLDVLFAGYAQDILNFDLRGRSIGYAKQFATKDKFISTGYCKVRSKQLDDGEVWDENCGALGGVTGHCGLFATGEDLAHYLKALFTSSKAQDFIRANQSALKSGENASLMGLRQGADYSSNPFAQGKSMGHMGFTGCAFWICPLTSRYAMLLTNRVISGRLSKDIKEFRHQGFHLLNEILPK